MPTPRHLLGDDLIHWQVAQLIEGMEDMPFIVVAEITAMPDRVDTVAEQIGILVEGSRSEPGCIQYDAFQQGDDKARFIIFESWENRAVWKTHMKMAALTSYLRATEGCTSEVTVREFAPLAEASSGS